MPFLTRKISQVPKAYDTLPSSYLEDYDISGNPVQ